MRDYLQLQLPLARVQRGEIVTTLRREWSGEGVGTGVVACLASAASPRPKTHSGSGSESYSPVKNLAAMHPPRQASYEPHDVHAPGLPGSRSD